MLITQERHFPKNQPARIFQEANNRQSFHYPLTTDNMNWRTGIAVATVATMVFTMAAKWASSAFDTDSLSGDQRLFYNGSRAISSLDRGVAFQNFSLIPQGSGMDLSSNSEFFNNCLPSLVMSFISLLVTQSTKAVWPSLYSCLPLVAGQGSSTTVPASGLGLQCLPSIPQNYSYGQGPLSFVWALTSISLPTTQWPWTLFVKVAILNSYTDDLESFSVNPSGCGIYLSHPSNQLSWTGTCYNNDIMNAILSLSYTNNWTIIPDGTNALRQIKLSMEINNSMSLATECNYEIQLVGFPTFSPSTLVPSQSTFSSTTIPPQNSSSAQDSSQTKVVIIGSAAGGGLVLLGTIGGVIYCVKKRKAKRRALEDKELPFTGIRSGDSTLDAKSSYRLRDDLSSSMLPGPKTNESLRTITSQANSSREDEDFEHARQQYTGAIKDAVASGLTSDTQDVKDVANAVKGAALEGASVIVKRVGEMTT